MAYEHNLSLLSVPLFALCHNDVPEIVVHGKAFVYDPGAKTPQLPPAFTVIGRSLLNPWQFIACDIAGREDFWSIGLSMHSGQQMHMKAIEILSQIANVTDDDLICPRQDPLDLDQVSFLKMMGYKALRKHHPNAGKHLLMLATCELRGYAKDTYWDIGHPIQKTLSALIGKEAKDRVQCVQDSCGLPSFSLNVRVLQNMWASFAEESNAKAVHIKELWLANPILVGGKGRLDSELTLAAGGKALVKEGSEGLLLVQSLPVAGQRVASVVLKLASGQGKSHLALGLLAALRANPDLPDVFNDLKRYLENHIEKWASLSRRFVSY